MGAMHTMHTFHNTGRSFNKLYVTMIGFRSLACFR